MFCISFSFNFACNIKHLVNLIALSFMFKCFVIIYVDFLRATEMCGDTFLSYVLPKTIELTTQSCLMLKGYNWNINTVGFLSL